MTTKTTQTSPKLVRALRLRDLILFNLVAVLGLRHLGTTAKFGPGSLLMWLIAAVFFFIPQGLAVVELSSRFPKEGGIYFWTKRALGEGHGFLCGWCYWINNVLYYPNLLISAAVIATFIFGKSGSGLSDRPPSFVSGVVRNLFFSRASPKRLLLRYNSCPPSSLLVFSILTCFKSISVPVSMDAR